jgi:hypothetical protein
MTRYRELTGKQRRGEAMTSEELEFFRAVYLKRTADYVARHPPADSVGLIPFIDGEGLYPDGRNSPPEKHLAAGLRMAASIRPLDSAGDASPEGKIVLLCIGMSNGSLEFEAFQKLTASSAGVNPHLVSVNGCQGGQTADKTADAAAAYWTVAEERLAAAGTTPNQVQAVWIKQAIAGPRQQFPTEARRLEEYLRTTVRNLAAKFPNLKVAFLSSRLYAGYARTGLNPEPHAYQSGYAVKWLIGAQISGDPELEFDDAGRGRQAPWLAWGPYLWADGVRERSDGLTYPASDLTPDDGTHPDAGARQKVARLLFEFLSRNPVSKGWFSGTGSGSLPR